MTPLTALKMGHFSGKMTHCIVIVEYFGNLRFWHSSSTGLLSKGLPSGPILAGLWAKTADTAKANRLNCIRILAYSQERKEVQTTTFKKKIDKKKLVVMMMERKLDHLFTMLLLQKKVFPTRSCARKFSHLPFFAFH